MNTDTLLTLLAIVLPLVELLGIVAAIHAVMNARTSQSAIAWGISLVTFPWVSLVLYAIFGRNKFNGYVLLRNSREKAIHHVIEELYTNAVEKGLLHTKTSESEYAFTQLAHLPITKYNKSELLIDGERTFASLFRDIDAAASYILVQFFIVKDDDLGRDLKARLIRKARAGVRVYFLYDEIGSHALPGAFMGEMEDAGVVTSAFHTTKGRTNRFQLNFRNHRKIVVIDGKTAYVGGHNVGDEYVSRHPRFGRWRDTHTRLQGPVVQVVQFVFLEDWYWARADVPELDWDPVKAEDGTENAMIVASGPADAIDTCGLMFVQAINTAAHRIWIASPYFVPDLQVLSALKLAALRGVEVRILLPEKPDHRTVYLASFAFYQNTLPLGIKLYRYTKGFMHQKVFIIDSCCAAVGTANLDNRSFRLNFELTYLNFDPGFIAEVDEMLDRDFSASRRVKLEDYTRRSFFFKLAVKFSRLLAPIL